MSMRELAKCLFYEQNLGILYWIYHPTRPSFVGKQACKRNPDGYNIINFKGKRYSAARLIYFIMTGKEVPKGMVIDHINRHRCDDRWVNLRCVTYSENNKNVTTKSNTGIKGIRKRCNRFEVYHNGPNGSVYVGSYPSLEEAVEVRSWYENIF